MSAAAKASTVSRKRPASRGMAKLDFRARRCSQGPFGALRLGQQHGPIRYVIVPFDESWNRPATFDHVPIKLPDPVSDRRIVRVDQQGPPGAVECVGKPSEMNFLHA